MQKNTYLITLALLMSVLFVSAQKRELNVETFSKIGFGIPGKLHLRQGSPQKVEIEGNKESLEKIEVKVEGNKLVVASKERWFDWGSSNEEKINIYVTVEKIEGIHVSGSGELVMETKISSNELDVKLSGSGSIQADVDVAQELDIAVSGSGKVNLKGSCKKMDTHLSGSGKMEITATIVDDAEFSISGSGKVVALGKAGTVKASISGSGKLLAADLETSKCNARISGSGEVEINVKNELDAQISGSGNVSYRGDPKTLKANASGSGSVRKL